MFQSVGWFMSEGNVAGTGAVIAPNWVLTAAHVVDGLPNTLMFSQSTSVYTQPPNFHSADAYYIHPGYNRGFAVGYDVALVHLSDPVSSTPATIFTGEDQRGTEIHVADIGQPGSDETGFLPRDGILREWNNIAQGFGGDSLALGREPQYWISDFDVLDDDTLPGEGQSTPGASGSPWFATINGTTYLVGVDDGILGAYGLGESWGLRVSTVAPWIAQTIGSVPEPSAWHLLTGTLAAFFYIAGCRQRSRQIGSKARPAH
jgi:hypothetical protein